MQKREQLELALLNKWEKMILKCWHVVCFAERAVTSECGLA